jgi:hypothetical protein
MRTPGFAAEATLYRSPSQYCTSGSVSAAGGILAQRRAADQSRGIVSQLLLRPNPCEGLGGCALARCECHATGGIMGPPDPPYFPCGFCVHF